MQEDLFAKLDAYSLNNWLTPSSLLHANLLLLPQLLNQESLIMTRDLKLRIRA